MQNQATHLADLIRKREKWVEANRENGFEDGITNLLTELYPDNAHFIYELLQNAEDTRAEVVRFTLSDADVRFEHNGKRLFTFADVESITSIGGSNKRNDPTSIGKFGVGFKAVFAYTNTPEIHSGDFHFEINNLVVPKPVPSTEVDGGTVFLFPFNDPKKDSVKAVEEIEHGLRALVDNTLLFLNHIHEIEYLLPTGDLGTLKRVDADMNGNGQRIEIHAAQPGKVETVSTWLRYRKEISIADEAGETKAHQVAIAFRLEPKAESSQLGGDDEKKGSRKAVKHRQTEWCVAPCEPGQVSIFFPAEKETSNLRFHLHAPFASTVARDSIRDCEANKELRDALAELTAEAMGDIRARGLLSMSLLAVLPNEDDSLPEFYEPIRDALVEVFQEKELLPTKSGSHVGANGLYRGPADISAVIDDDDLSFLSGYSSPLWAANPPQKGQREDKFLDSLEIEEWSWGALKKTIQETASDEEQKRKIEGWLAKKPDPWLMRFYALMEACHDATSNYHYPEPLTAPWKTLAGVRVANSDGKDDHTSPGDAYFPQQISEKGKRKPIDVPATIRLVKPEVYEKGRLGDNTKKAARDFLKRVGVREYDERAEVERRLNWYAEPGAKSMQSNPDHYRDLQLFINFVKKNPADIKLFQGIQFLLVVSEAENKLYRVAPENVYLDAPYETTGLGELVTIHRQRKMWPDYLAQLGKDSEYNDFVSFLKNIGVMHQLKVTKANALRNANIHSPGRERDSKINVDWTIEHLQSYLSGKNQTASRLVWMSLLGADKAVAIAEYRPNQRHGIQKVESQLVQLLKLSAWIPDAHGTFRKPQDMLRDMLPKEFPYDDRNGLLTAIGFEKRAREASEEFKTRDAEARRLGFASAGESEEALALLQAHREGRVQVRAKETVKSLEGINHGGPAVPLGGGLGGSSGELVGEPDSAIPPSSEPNVPRVLQRISERIRQTEIGSAPPTDAGQGEPPDDEDVFTPAPVNYGRRIARAEERNATEIARLEREQELLNRANALPRYSYGWFLALLELECLASSEKNVDSKTISIAFGKVERDPVSPKTIILKEPSRFVPPSVEEFSGVRVDLDFDDGSSGKLHVESFTAKEFLLLGKLESVDELAGIDVKKVREARIEVQNPSFLLQELLNRFMSLGFDDQFDMRANLTPNIEFVFGPPGTGKTTHLAEQVLIPLMRGAGASKVLVLTPTNKAADVLTNRVIDYMGADTSYHDWLVRFGTCADSRIEAAGVWRDRSFDIEALERYVTITTIARYTYDGFATDNGKFHAMDWDAIVVDEASMVPLVNIIYPLYQQEPEKFIIAGDPFQIEPVVAVEQWKGENIYTLVGLDKPGSFAQPRTEPHPFPVTNLETQYRSIPSIGDVFSHFSYNGILKHHRSTHSQRLLRLDGIEINSLNLIKFPVSKYESIYRAKRLSSGTPYQTYSALFTFEFVRWLAEQIETNHTGEPPFRIGIIAPYRAQANLLSKLNDSRANTPSVEIQVGTIHGFQGDECDIIIAVLNPPPSISASGQMFLNKQNILNVAISRARDYLFIVMPDGQTQDVRKLRQVARIESLIKNGGAYSEFHSQDVEETILGNAHYLVENTFSTGHQMVNVYVKPVRYYEVRSDDSAIDVQIHEED